jgi:hypothetical protein
MEAHVEAETSQAPPCLIAASPSLRPASLKRELTHLRSAGIDAVLVTVASLEDTAQTLLRVAQ